MHAASKGKVVREFVFADVDCVFDGFVGFAYKARQRDVTQSSDDKSSAVTGHQV